MNNSKNSSRSAKPTNNLWKKFCTWPLPALITVALLVGFYWLVFGLSLPDFESLRTPPQSSARTEALDKAEFLSKQSDVLRNMAFLAITFLGFWLAIWRGRMADKQVKKSQEQIETAQDSIKTIQDGQKFEYFRSAVSMLASNYALEQKTGAAVLCDLAQKEPEEYYIKAMEVFCEFMRHRNQEIHPHAVAQIAFKQLRNPDDPLIAKLEEEAWDLSQLPLSRARFQKCNLRDTNLNKANLSYANFIEANLNNANLSYANLSYANLIGAGLSYAVLSKAKLSIANLIGATLNNANLINADLYEARLRGVNLNNADLKNATLTGASLSGANLGGAKLLGANLYRANIFNTNLLNVISNPRSIKYAYAECAVFQRTMFASIDNVWVWSDCPNARLPRVNGYSLQQVRERVWFMDAQHRNGAGIINFITNKGFSDSDLYGKAAHYALVHFRNNIKDYFSKWNGKTPDTQQEWLKMAKDRPPVHQSCPK